MRYIIVMWYIVQVVTGIQNGDFWPRALKFCKYWMSVSGKHFTHQNEQDKYPLYRSHSTHNMTLRSIQNLNGFSIEFFCSHSTHSVTAMETLCMLALEQLHWNDILKAYTPLILKHSCLKCFRDAPPVPFYLTHCCFIKAVLVCFDGDEITLYWILYFAGLCSGFLQIRSHIWSAFDIYLNKYLFA